jgi:rhodanese-related sulfurtransferase
MAAIMIMIAGGTGHGQEKSPQFIEARALSRSMENREAVMIINVASYLECLDTRIPASQCMPCDQEQTKADLFPADKETKLIFYGGAVPVAPNCRVIEDARRYGFAQVYILKGGLPAWRRAGYETESVQRIPRRPVSSVYPKDLAAWQKAVRNHLILDIRSPEQFKDHHIEGALNIPLSHLHLRYQDIPLDRILMVVDEEGSRNLLAASFLARKGFVGKTVRLVGGMAAWDAFIKRGASR